MHKIWSEPSSKFLFSVCWQPRVCQICTVYSGPSFVYALITKSTQARSYNEIEPANNNTYHITDYSKT